MRDHVLRTASGSTLIAGCRIPFLVRSAPVAHERMACDPGRKLRRLIQVANPFSSDYGFSAGLNLACSQPLIDDAIFSTVRNKNQKFLK